MKKTLYNISLVLGIVLLFGGILFYGLDRFAFVTLENSQLIGVILIFGVGLTVGGACELLIKPSKKMQIEANDERNVVIGKTAKSFAFEIMTLLLPISVTIMVIFNYISTGAFLVLFGVYTVSQIAFIARLWYLQNKM